MKTLKVHYVAEKKDLDWLFFFVHNQTKQTNSEFY